MLLLSSVPNRRSLKDRLQSPRGLFRLAQKSLYLQRLLGRRHLVSFSPGTASQGFALGVSLPYARDCSENKAVP